jgi:hypothetical protein
MVMYRYARFEDLITHPGVQYFPPSRPPEGDIALPGLILSDTPDDFVVLEDAVLCRGGGVAWRGLWLSASIHYMPDHWRGEAWLPGKMTEDGTAIDLNPDLIHPTTTIEKPVLLIDSLVGSYNFGHSIHDSMPYGLLFQRARKVIPELRPITTPFKFQNQQQIFSVVFDCPYRKCVLHGNGSHVKKLVLARRQSIMNTSSEFPDDRWSLPFAGIRHIRSALHAALQIPEEIGLLPGAAPHNVFLHRFPNAAEQRPGSVLQGRNFSNHYRLFEALMKESFFVFEPGWMTLEQIGGMLARASTVAGVHGAQLANLVFCRPLTRIFEIRGYPGNWRSIEALCAVLGHAFTVLQQAKPTDPDAPEFDVRGILAALKVETKRIVHQQLKVSDLGHSRWRFGRGDGQVITPVLVLLPDGSVSGYSHPNEFAWKLEGGRLALADINGVITSVFDPIECEGDNVVMMKGLHTFPADGYLTLQRLDK